MRERALHQEKQLAIQRSFDVKQLAIQRRVDELRDKIDELEVELDEKGRDVYRQIIIRKKDELRKLEEQLDK